MLAVVSALSLFLAGLMSAIAGPRSIAVTIRGKTQQVWIYDPPVTSSNTKEVMIVSGDLGWVGLPVTIAEHLQGRGFRAIGFNARTYLASFTSRSDRLQEDQVPRDFETIITSTASSRSQNVIMIGISEGAGLSVLALAQSGCAQCQGLVALGLPARTSMGWRWSDFTMWITKSDPNEPMADTALYLPRLNLPLAMIHSTHDEYDSIERARVMYTLAPEPKYMREINASNHRFSNKISVVLDELDSALRWLNTAK
jgi:pimeloyl-ACP methyl ester carboxylesterase